MSRVQSGAVAEGIAEGVRLTFLDEGQRVPVEMLVTQELASALVRAALSQGDGRFALSFSSLFLGIWTTRNDAATRWLGETLTRETTSTLLRKANVSEAEVQRLVERPEAALGRWATEPLTRTVSARSALDEAARLAHDLGGIVDTRHLIAAYLSLPEYHEEDFRRLLLDRHALAASFGAAMAHAYVAEEAFWNEFGAHGRPPVVTKRSGPAPKVTGEPSPGPDLGAARLEGHVASALTLAAETAKGRAIGPLDVILAVLAQPGTPRSKAFRRLASIVPIASDPEHLKLAHTVSSKAPPDASRLTPEFARLLATIQRAERENGSKQDRLWGRDLVTAALLTEDAELERALAHASCPLDDARDQWFGFVTSDAQGPIARGYWEGIWRLAGVPLPAPYRSGYATETDQGDDKLGIEDEAHAFARLILDRNVAPPLSIGLLGDWGSGKSFFIEQIKKQIQTLKHGAHPELYSNVIEIEFNAWHASDSNLWASLVTHIFDEIWSKVQAPETSTKNKADAKDGLTAAIEEARGAVHQSEGQVTVAQAGLAAAEDDLERRKHELAWQGRTEVTSAALKEIAEQAGWRRPLETINDVTNAFRDLSSSSKRLEMVAASLFERPLLHVALPVGVALAGTLGVWHWLDGVEANPIFVQLSKWATTAAGAVSALVLPVRQAVTKVNDFSNKLETVEKDYDASVAALDDDDPVKARLTNARRELESAEASVKAAKDKLGELLNQRATMGPERRLGAFLEERVQSSQYRSQQGIISLVHKDFRVLSQLMKNLRDAPKSTGDGSTPEERAQLEKVREAIQPFDRIVLYVDDLDRCRPEHVVAMLEAVHLLLALDLFVAVVAVDARWLTRSLEVHYKDLLGTEEHEDDRGLRVSTPQGYLEKIFQITYALGPMDPKRFSDYVRFLAASEGGAGEEKEEKDESGSKRETASKDETSSQDATRTSAKKQAEVSTKSSGTSGIRARTAEGSGAPPETDETSSEPSENAGSNRRKDAQLSGEKAARERSSVVTITKGEQDVIAALVPLLPTPRIAKRLVNVYRLLKSSMKLDALARFQSEHRERSCLLMLAILFGRPAVAEVLLRALHEQEAPFDRPERSLVDAIKLYSERPERDLAEARAEWQVLHRTLLAMKLEQTVGDCAREPFDIARYSLAAGRDWHTWKRR